MFRFLLAACALLLVAGCFPERPADVDDAKVALLKQHQADIQAHLDGDVDALMASIPDEMLLVGDGHVYHQPAERLREFFAGYLEGAEYSRYEDLMVPHAEVSDDGTMGWVVCRQAVERTEPDPGGGRRDRAFTYAGIMLYRNEGKGWVKVGNVSTFVPGAAEKEEAAGP